MSNSFLHALRASVVGFTFYTSGLFTALAQTNEYRALWVDAFGPGYRNASEVATMMDRLRALNMNAVIPEIRARADAFYNGSPYEPRAAAINDPDPNYDPLGDMLAKAHDTSDGKQRIEVHAWMVTYKTSTGSGPSAWMHKHHNGSVSNGEFDPGHPDVQRRVYNVAMDITSRYDIDGLNFDYIRYPETTLGNASPWGYNDVTVARFNSKYGRTGIPATNDVQWAQFRRDQVTSLLRKIYLNVMAIKPQVKISADTITWSPGPVDDASWTNCRPYNDVLQDWRSWLEEGILDLNVTMSYFRVHVPAQDSDFYKWGNFAKDRKFGRHLIIGPAFYLNYLSNSIVQMRSTRELTTNGNRSDGIGGYDYGQTSIIPGSEPFSEFTKAVTQPSIYDPITPPIYAARAEIPEAPWKTNPTTGHLKGFVTGGTISNYLDGATMTVSGPVNRTFISDATGFYGSVGLPPGNYTVTAAFPNLGQRSTNITVIAGLVTTADLLLAPDITIHTHPQSQSVIQGGEVNFTVEASGSAPLQFQWKFNDASILDATNSSYTITGVQFTNAGSYSVVVSNLTGAVTSSNALLTVQGPPLITTHPQSQIGVTGTPVTFTVEATGTAPLGYQWQFNGTNILDATNSSFTIDQPHPSTNGNYSVIVTNAVGLATSMNASLTVHYRLVTEVSNGVIAQSPNLASYPPGAQVTLTAIPNPNYTFTGWSGNANGTNHSITITMSSDQVVRAAFVFNGLISEIIVDNPDAVRTGDWTLTANFPGYYGTNYTFARATNTAATATTIYQPVIPETALYDVYIWYTAGGNRVTNASWLISCVDGDQTVFVNQQSGGSQWRLIAQNKTFAAGTNGFIRVSNEASDVSKVVMADAVRLVKVLPPEITLAPQSQSVVIGRPAIFFVGVRGGTPMQYQWQFNGTNIPAATLNVFTLSAAHPTNAGHYSVLVTNLSGFTASAAAALTVIPPKISSLTFLDQNHFQLQLDAGSEDLIFEGSSDFTNWVALTNVIFSNGIFEIIDPATNMPRRFYRAKSP